MLHSGFVSIIGRPSVGKSTLLNQIIGEKVSIISNIPQTTRNQIRGIYTDDNSQIIFLDTPGWHLSEKKINKKLIAEIDKSLDETDVILYMLDVTRSIGDEENEIIEILKKAKKPILVVLNKYDLVKSSDKDSLLRNYKDKLDVLNVHDFIIISAKKNENLQLIIQSVQNLLPEGPLYYPADYYTDQPFTLRISEIIREKVFQFTHEEIPHSTYVEIVDFEEDKKKNMLRIKAIIFVEQDSQKAIVIGKNGSLIKKIGTLSRKDIEQVFGRKIFLDIQVKVKKKWKSDEKVLSSLFSKK